MPGIPLQLQGPVFKSPLYFPSSWISLQFFENSPVLFQIEEIYQKAHAAIRKDPTHPQKAVKAGKPKRWTAKKLTLAERKAKVKAAKAEFLAQIEDQKE